VIKPQNKIVLIIIFALLPLGIRAQQPESKVSEDQPISPPPLLDSKRPTLALLSEEDRSNYLFAGIDFADVFTDNVNMTSTAKISDFSYLLQPKIGFSRLTPRLKLDASFQAGWITYQHNVGRDQLFGNFAVDLSYRCSEHFDLRLSNTFVDSTGLFPGSSTVTSESTIGTVEQPNNSLIVSPTQRTLTNTSLIELSDQVGPNSVAGLRGSYSFLDYPGSSENTGYGQLYDTQTYLGEAFYNHRLSPGEWVGVTLRTQKFDTQLSSSDTDSLLLYYSVEPARNITLSVFGGPEYAYTPWISQSANAPGEFTGHLWTPAYGATFHWQGENTSVVAGYSHQLSDGGGLSTAVILQGANVSLRSQLTSRLQLNLDFEYSVNNPLGSGHSYNSFSGLVEFQQRLTKNLSARVGYARQRQELPLTLAVANANLVWISVSYQILRPLKR